MMTTNINNNLLDITQKIRQIATQCGRDPSHIELVAVSKTKPVSLIQEAIDAGQFVFGENYVQEGVNKIIYFNENPPKHLLTWHFIGALQSNKSRLVAEHFDWIHTIDRFKIAQRLNEQRPSHMAKLNVLIQVNISQETSKSGVSADELMNLSHQIALLPNLKLRGLMAIPEIENEQDKQRSVFEKMQQLLQILQKNHSTVDTLSMGMSSDMQAAIMAGSTMVRIGTAIFGTRQFL